MSSLLGHSFRKGRLVMSLIESRGNGKYFIGGVKVSSSKKRGGRHNRGGTVDDDSVYDFVNLRYRGDIERFRRGGCRRKVD